MIPQFETPIIEGNVDFSKAIPFQIATNVHTFNALRKQLYSRPAWSCIREILTNSVDAQKSVGKDNLPITIIEGDPFVAIDQGGGISFQTIVDVVGWYGESTKRDSNDQEGMFGFGMKSPFAISTQYTVETVIEEDGKRLKQIYLLSEDKTGAGIILPIIDGEIKRTYTAKNGKVHNYSYTEVDEPTGTKVKIPIQSKYKEEVHRSIIAHSNFLPVRPIVAWEKGTVDWVDPLETNDEWFIYDCEKLSKLIPGYNFNTIYNGIPYEVPNHYYRLPNFYFRLKTGDIELNASREQVVNVHSTGVKLNIIYDKYKNESRKKLEDAIAACNSAEEVMAAFQTHSVYIKFFDEWNTTFLYKGDKIKLVNDDIKYAKRNSPYYKTKLSIDKYDNGVNISRVKKEQFIIVDNAEKLLNTTIRRKILQYIDENKFKELFILFRYEDVENTKPLVYDKFVEELKGAAYDITLVKLHYPKKTAIAGSKPKNITTIWIGNSKWDKKELDITQGEFIYEIKSRKNKFGYTITRHTFPPKVNDNIISTIVKEKSHLEKKIKGLTNWYTPEEYYKKYINQHKLTEEEIEHLKNYAGSISWNYLAKEGLDINKNIVEKYKLHLGVIHFAINSGLLTPPIEHESRQRVIKKYPLLDWVKSPSGNTFNHIKQYKKLIDQEQKGTHLSQFLRSNKNG